MPLIWVRSQLPDSNRQKALIPIFNESLFQECTYRRVLEEDGQGRRKLEVGHRAFTRFLFISVTFVGARAVLSRCQDGGGVYCRGLGTRRDRARTEHLGSKGRDEAQTRRFLGCKKQYKGHSVCKVAKGSHCAQ